ncbi:MAG: hypothetical protein MJ132_06415 [Clostridia bacterium]|nr:hypothetical protein [Clostridia bacterium]
MLDAVTKKYIDASTEEQFAFSFFCDCCGKVVSTTPLTFRPGFKKKLFISKAERKAREMLWQKDHDAAYERANIEALKQLNRCVVCGAAICNDCTVECEETDGKTVCIDCAKKNRFKGMIWNDDNETFSVDFSTDQTKDGT